MQAFPGVSSGELEVGEHAGRMEINRSAFALVRVVVRGRVELPAFRFSGVAYAKLMSIVRVLRRSLVAAVCPWLLLLLSPVLSAVPVKDQVRLGMDGGTSGSSGRTGCTGNTGHG